MSEGRERYAKGADIQYHYVWKTKYSYKILSGDVALRLRRLLRDICNSRGITIERGNIRSDHVHILVVYDSYDILRLRKNTKNFVDKTVN